jgi:hypothetical protein
MRSDIKKRFYSLCVQGQVGKALQFLEKNAAGSGHAAALLKKYRERFLQAKPARVATGDPFVATLIKIYHDYYCRVLMEDLSVKRGEAYLCRQLNRFCSEFVQTGRGRASLDKLEKKLAKLLERRGYFSLFGRILPYRSLLVWQSENEHDYTVRLVEGKQRVRVVFMDGFIEQSWMHFATCGRHGNGGWVSGNKAKSIYCVKRAYKLDSDKFLSAYLAHEAQHFKDLNDFPKLSQSDLEYRAKLAELVSSARPNLRANKFAAQCDINRSSPHAFASYCLMRDLSIELGLNAKPQNTKAWQSVPIRKLKEAAELLILRHSLKMRAAGRQVAGVISHQ